MGAPAFLSCKEHGKVLAFCIDCKTPLEIIRIAIALRKALRKHCMCSTGTPTGKCAFCGVMLADGFYESFKQAIEGQTKEEITDGQG